MKRICAAATIKAVTRTARKPSIPRSLKTHVKVAHIEEIEVSIATGMLTATVRDAASPSPRSGTYSSAVSLVPEVAARSLPVSAT